MLKYILKINIIFYINCISYLVSEVGTDLRRTGSGTDRCTQIDVRSVT